MLVKKQTPTEESEAEQTPAEETVSTKTSRLNNALELIKATFGIDSGYMVTAFKDKGSTLTATLISRDFEVSVTIRDTESFNI